MPLLFYLVLYHSNHLSSCRRNATSSYSQHPLQLPKVRKWGYKVAEGTNTLVVLAFLPASNSSAIIINDELKTHHMRSIRGKVLQELIHWHNSKFTEDINQSLIPFSDLNKYLSYWNTTFNGNVMVK